MGSLLPVRRSKNEDYGSFEPRRQDIRAIAKKAMQELATALIGMALCTPFAQGLFIARMGIGALTSTLANALLRTTLPDNCSEQVCPWVFVLFNLYDVGSCIHEIGHALAAKALFVTSPQIILSFEGAKTCYSTRHLTLLGNKLSRRTSILFITLAGPGVAWVASVIAITIGKLFHNLYWIAAGSYHSILHAVYAFSALLTSPGNASHDFARLKTFGMHPFIAIMIYSFTASYGIALQKEFRFPTASPFHTLNQDLRPKADNLSPC